MAYTKQTWQDYPNQTTPVNAQRLNHIEDGLFNAAAEADKKLNTNQGVSQAGKFPRVGQDGNIEFVNPGGIIISQLDDIPDVNITNPTDRQVLSYDEDNNEWVNSDPTGGTEVVANPTLAGTESDLDGIQIGQTKYKVNKIDDSSTSATKVWSSQKVHSEVANLQSQIDDIQVGGGGSVIRVEFTEEEAGDSIIFSMAGMDTITKTVPSVAPYIVEISTVEMGTMTITDTTLSKSITLTIDTYELYAIQFASGFDFHEWLTLGSVVGTYASLEEVLADEKALRQLFNKHASVDYLVECCESSLDADVETIVQTDLCAKWINLRDYALDTLYANEYIKTAMDEFDKYFYGELVEKDGEYVPKGNVPIMTANNAPYGEAIGSDTSTLKYHCFDGTATGYYPTNAIGSYCGYKFTNPVCVKRLHAEYLSTNDVFKLQGSNDGTNYTDIGSTFKNGPSVDVNFDNDEYYLYYRVYQTTKATSQTGMGWYNLQFYGRELKVSVPKMTSNNAPWGKAIASNVYEGTLYNVFNPNNTSRILLYANGEAISDQYMGYKFGYPVKLKSIIANVWGASSETNTINVKAQYTTDGTTWIDIPNSSKNVSGNDTSGGKYICDIDIVAIGIRVRRNTDSSVRNTAFKTLQFFGLDYSEHTERRWIYDHGVEVEEIGVSSSAGTSPRIEKESSSVTIYTDQGGNYLFLSTNNVIDLTEFNLERVGTGNRLVLGAPKITYVGGDAFGLITERYNNYLDISSVNGNNKPSIYSGDTVVRCEVTEWWLE